MATQKIENVYLEKVETSSNQILYAKETGA